MNLAGVRDIVPSSYVLVIDGRLGPYQQIESKQKGEEDGNAETSVDLNQHCIVRYSVSLVGA